jgi:hypothetical protein
MRAETRDGVGLFWGVGAVADSATPHAPQRSQTL